MEKYTVCICLKLAFKGDPKPCLSIIVTRKGTARSADCSWAKVVMASGHQDAYDKGVALIKSGDPGDPLETIPVAVKTFPPLIQPDTVKVKADAA